VHVVVQARPLQRAVDLDAADADLKQLLDQLDGLARQPARQERPEVLAPSSRMRRVKAMRGYSSCRVMRK